MICDHTRSHTVSFIPVKKKQRYIGKSMPKKIVLLLLYILFFFFLFFGFLVLVRSEKIALLNTSIEDAPNFLHEHGYCLLKQAIPQEQIDVWRAQCREGQYKEVKENLVKQPHLLAPLQKVTTSEYQFQDYIWIIQKSSVHTCHRDNNGDFFNEGQEWPSYTVLVYLENMEKCLSVLPQSHIDKHSVWVNWEEPMHDILCDAGDVVIFNANLIHVGTINQREDNLRIQLKWTHPDDIAKIGYYEDFNKVLNEDNQLPIPLRKMQRNISCLFPGVSDWTQGENIRTARGSDNGVDVGISQQVFSYLFYGNKDFYNLPNAF
jgi:hypothetical protein